jgi:hypothetical protein
VIGVETPFRPQQARSGSKWGMNVKQDEACCKGQGQLGEELKSRIL